MKKFLGTGTSAKGIPVIGSTHPVCLYTNPKDKRLRSSVMITDDEGKKFSLIVFQIFVNKCSL